MEETPEAPPARREKTGVVEEALGSGAGPLCSPSPGCCLICLLICLILASGAPRHLLAHLPDTRQMSRATPACSSA